MFSAVSVGLPDLAYGGVKHGFGHVSRGLHALIRAM